MLKVPNCSSKTTSADKREMSGRRSNWCSYGRSTQENGATGRVRLGTRDQFHRDLYSALLPAYCWDPSSGAACGKLNTHHGGVFNLEFSPDGSLLVAACEKKSILVMDPLRGSLVKHVENAHNDCVNCIKFLDSRMFASCSDDNSVSIWDIRFLKKRIRTLKGHSNWVKNIEFAHDEGLLVTSGFDGRIYTWDINRLKSSKHGYSVYCQEYSEGDVQFNRAFHTDGLMRTKLSPDGRKLMLCTSNGFLMVVHDLDLHNLSRDLRGFNPNIYNRMQQSNTSIHVGCLFNRLFRARRNRVELISDFPTGNDAEVISSLQVHPQGWCILSRNTSADENSEWTTVHDIQDFADWSQTLEEEDEDDEYQMQFPDDCGTDSDTLPFYDSSTNEERAPSRSAAAAAESTSPSTISRPVVHIRFNCRPNADGSSNAADSDQPRLILEGRGTGSGNASGSGSGGGAGASSSSRNAGPSSSGSVPEQTRSVDFTLRISSLEAFEAVAATLAAVRANQRISGRDQEGGETAAAAAAAATAAPSVPNVQVVRNDDEDDDDDSDSMSNYSNSSDDEEQRVIIGDANALRQEISDRVAFVIRSGPHVSGSRSSDRILRSGGIDGAVPSSASTSATPVKRHYRTRPRLTHYVAEPNVGRGFIKELCFSTDGRLVCSPCGHGVRILALNSNCSEMCDCIPDRPTNLYEVTSSICHPYVVVSTKFSPTHCLLVSGCLSGKICFYQPVLG